MVIGGSYAVAIGSRLTGLEIHANSSGLYLFLSANSGANSQSILSAYHYYLSNDRIKIRQVVTQRGSVKRTGIFFIYFQGERLRDFPQALAGILDKENISYYDAVYDSHHGLYYLELVSE